MEQQPPKVMVRAISVLEAITILHEVIKTFIKHKNIFSYHENTIILQKETMETMVDQQLLILDRLIIALV